MKIISSTKMPENLGHYSMCIEHNDTLYLSGQIPINQLTNEVSGSIEEQTLLLLQNIENTLIAAGSTKNHILRNEVYLKNIKDWPIVNTIYSDFFEKHKPTRMVIGGVELHNNSLIGITTTASVSARDKFKKNT